MAQSVQGEEVPGRIDFYRKVREFRDTYKGMVSAVLEGRLSAKTAKEQLNMQCTRLLHHPSASDCLEHNEALAEYLDVVAEEFQGTDAYRRRQTEQFKAECDAQRMRNETARQQKKAALVTLAAGAGIVALAETARYVCAENLEYALEQGARFVSENSASWVAGAAGGTLAAVCHNALRSVKDWARTRTIAGMLAVSTLLSTMHSSSDTHYAKPHKAAELVQESQQYGLTLTDMIRLPWVNK
jgi:hypothetical protein